jgi:hypothetical protein
MVTQMAGESNRDFDIHCRIGISDSFVNEGGSVEKMGDRKSQRRGKILF